MKFKKYALLKVRKLSYIIPLLGIIITSSATAFRAIYLSRYSEQAAATRKSAQLTDIRIRKEISSERILHYDSVKKNLEGLLNIVKKTENPQFHALDYKSKFKLGEAQLGKDDLNNDFLLAKNHMLQHLPDNGKKIIDDFFNSIEKIPKFNGDIDELIKKLESILKEEAIKSGKIEIRPQTTTPKNGAVVGSEGTISTIISILIDSYNMDGKNISSIIKDSFPTFNKSPDKTFFYKDWDVESTKISYLEFTCAQTDSFSVGTEVIDLIRNVASDHNILTDFIKLQELKIYISSKIDILSKEINGLTDVITNHEYNEIADCCPFKEYQGA